MTRSPMIGVTLLVCLMTAPGADVVAQSPAALTALDYLEIEQLTYQYGYALDSGAGEGYAYADLFTPGGTFTGTNQGPSGRTYTGRDALAALARGGRRGPNWVSHYVTNVVIEPAPGGGGQGSSADAKTGRSAAPAFLAIGRAYVAIFDIGNGGNGAPSSVSNAGIYNDVYEKTAGGWRFRSRTFYASKSGEGVQPPAAAIGVPRPLAATSPAAGERAGGLTVEDHLAIQQLVARYAYALDQNADNGAAYADLFTDDAVFRQPRTEGRANLAKLASSAPHGPNYVRHFITNHVIEATPDGATGKQYLVVADIRESGQPGSIFLGGQYEDVYARTPQGWRFKARTFISSATGDSR